MFFKITLICGGSSQLLISFVSLSIFIKSTVPVSYNNNMYGSTILAKTISLSPGSLSIEIICLPSETEVNIK